MGSCIRSVFYSWCYVGVHEVLDFGAFQISHFQIRGTQPRITVHGLESIFHLSMVIPLVRGMARTPLRLSTPRVSALHHDNTGAHIN
jgi:hypothetical protein